MDAALAKRHGSLEVEKNMKINVSEEQFNQIIEKLDQVKLELIRLRSLLVPEEEPTPDEIKALEEEPKEYISEEELVNSLRKRVKSDSKRQVHNKGPRSI